MTQAIQTKVNGDSNLKKGLQDAINLLAGVDIIRKEQEQDPNAAQASYMTANNANLARISQQEQERSA